MIAKLLVIITRTIGLMEISTADGITIQFIHHIVVYCGFIGMSFGTLFLISFGILSGTPQPPILAGASFG